MYPDESLFGEDAPTPAVSPTEVAHDVLADWQVDLVRRALDGTGVSEMNARQQLIEDLAGRPVESLRHLTSSEARSIAEQRQTRVAATNPRPSRNSWDDRDEDTWIDRL